MQRGVNVIGKQTPSFRLRRRKAGQVGEGGGRVLAARTGCFLSFTFNKRHETYRFLYFIHSDSEIN